MDFFDIDKVIEKRRKSVLKNLSNKRRGFFRNLEKKITLRFLNKTGTVISLGGGAFMNNFIRKKHLVHACFWLDVELNTLIKRVNSKTSKRPLLNNKIQLEKWKEFLMKEQNTSFSNFRIRCKNQNKKLIVEKILKLYEKNFN